VFPFTSGLEIRLTCGVRSRTKGATLELDLRGLRIALDRGGEHFWTSGNLGRAITEALVSLAL
jgi:hypothetical protein